MGIQHHGPWHPSTFTFFSRKKKLERHTQYKGRRILWARRATTLLLETRSLLLHQEEGRLIEVLVAPKSFNREKSGYMKIVLEENASHEKIVLSPPWRREEWTRRGVQVRRRERGLLQPSF
jgi:hypothetical protein